MRSTQIRASVDSLRALVESNGRDAYSIKIILGVSLIVDETDEKAEDKEKVIRASASNLGAEALIGGWTGVDLSVYGLDEDLTQVGVPTLKGVRPLSACASFLRPARR